MVAKYLDRIVSSLLLISSFFVKTDHQLTHFPPLYLTLWSVWKCVTNRSERMMWEHHQPLQSAYLEWIRLMLKEEGTVYKTCSDRCIELCVLLDAGHELFCVFGDFLCVMDAGRRGNKITAVLTRISTTLNTRHIWSAKKTILITAAVLIRVNTLLAWGRGNSSAWEGEGCAWIPSFPLPPPPAPLLRPSMQNHTLFRYRHTVIDIINSVTGNQ